jgi:hypothetical protein
MWEVSFVEGDFTEGTLPMPRLRRGSSERLREQAKETKAVVDLQNLRYFVFFC